MFSLALWDKLVSKTRVKAQLKNKIKTEEYKHARETTHSVIRPLKSLTGEGGVGSLSV